MVMEILISLILLVVGIAVLVIIHFCIVGRVFSRTYNNGDIADQIEMRIARSPSMSSEEIKELPCFHYKVEERENSPLECAVCLENFKVGDKCRLLPKCNHIFHAECIDSWLSKTAACPICRTGANLRKIDGQSSGSSEVGVELT